MIENFLITGTRNGFGKYAHEKLGGFELTRDTKEEEIGRIQEQGVNTIIHCAFNTSKNVTSLDLPKYIEDNVFLTKRLTEIPHKKFIFISSIEVYPCNGQTHSEKEEINVNKTDTIYGTTKLISERIAIRGSPSPLILRCSGLLGEYMGENNLIKLIEDEKPELSLSGNSELNCVQYKDIMDFIKFGIENKLEGIYNLVSSKNILFSEVAKIFKKDVKFGNYLYNVGKINNNKVVEIFPTFKKTSKEVIKQFFNENG